MTDFEKIKQEKILTDSEIQELIMKYESIESDDRTLQEMINGGELPELKNLTLQKGKVSDSLYGESLKTKDGIPLRIMIRTARISTHDENRGAVPFKDQVLALNHDYMLSLVKDILGSAQMSVKNLDPRTCVILAENTEPPAYENVLRAYMAKTSTSTSLYQAWLKAKDNSEESFVYAGREFDTSDLFPNCRLTEIIDTPSTKKGVDVTQDPKYFIENGFVTEEEYEDTKFKSIMAFQLVSRMLRKKGIAFVDTKTEHGKNSKDETVGIDELYTMDSSRFWLLDENGDLLLENGEPIQIGKENARKMVTQKGQQFTKEQREQIAFDYIKGYQRLTGKRFVPDMRSRVERYRDGLKTLFENI